MIVNAKYGQLSNRIITIAHAMATAIEEGQPLRVANFDDLKDKYECTVTWSNPVILKRSLFWDMERRLHSLAKRFLHVCDIKGVVSGWNYRDFENIDKHHDEIVKFFTPKTTTVAYAMDFAEKYFIKDRVTIGVHIRRGDYAQWQNGRYFFDDVTYATIMRSLASELKTAGKNARFVLFSNSALNLTNFGGEYELEKSDGSPYDDHYLMSRCDYLIGPPSTFSIWASWVGKVPLYHINHKEDRPTLSGFKWCKGC